MLTVFKVLGYVFIVLLVIIISGILIMYIYSDTIELMRYNHAKRVTGKVIEYRGKFGSANYGVRQPRTMYHIYVVEFNACDKDWSGTFLTRKRLDIGSNVEVRYEVYSSGDIEIVNSQYRDRFVRFLACSVIGILIAIFQIVTMRSR